jgi:hypothetical protein
MKNKLVFLLMFSCSNPILKIVDAPKKQESKYFEASYLGKEFDLLSNNDTINREKIIIVIRNLSIDTIFYECYNDSTITSFRYAHTKYNNEKNINMWGFSYYSNYVGDNYIELLKMKVEHILPSKEKKIKFLKFGYNQSSDSAGVGFDFVIKNKPSGGFIYFKNK